MTTTGTETHTGQERERVGERERENRWKIRRGREGKKSVPQAFLYTLNYLCTIGQYVQCVVFSLCRSPWSNKYDPPLEDGAVPSDRLRRLEIEANQAFDTYREL